MEQDTILCGGVDALYTMKENLLELEGYKAMSSELALKEDQLEKQLEYKEKVLTEEIMISIKKRKLEVEASFDEQFDKIKARIKKVKAKKDKEKNAQISERIKTETADLTKEKIRLQEEMKATFQKNSIPRVFNNSFYYALFLPRCFKDICTILLTIFLGLFVFPYLIVYKFLMPSGTFFLVIIYIITVIIFGGLYLLINTKTKERHPDALIDIRANRAKQAKNQKHIDAIAKEIRKDKDESSYGLDNFTDELGELEKELTAVAEEKKEALVEFETKTRIMIEGKIRATKKDEFDSLKVARAQTYEEQKQAEEKVKLYSLEILNKYETYIGKDMMTISVVDNLIEIIQTGQASTVEEAVDVYKKSRQTVS